MIKTITHHAVPSDIIALESDEWRSKVNSTWLGRNGPYFAYQSPQGNHNVCVLIRDGDTFGFKCLIDLMHCWTGAVDSKGGKMNLAYTEYSVRASIEAAMAAKREVKFLETPLDLYRYMGNCAKHLSNWEEENC